MTTEGNPLREAAALLRRRAASKTETGDRWAALECENCALAIEQMDSQPDSRAAMLYGKLLEISQAIGYDSSWIDSATCNVVAHAINDMQRNYRRLWDEMEQLRAAIHD